MRKIILYGILIFIFSIGIGFFYSSLWKKDNISKLNSNLVNELANLTETSSVLDEKISYDANLTLKKYYSCGHFKSNSSELPVELVNLTKSEVEKMYPEWGVEEFSSDNVVLSKNIDKICDEHYVLKLEDDNVNVYHLENQNEMELYKETGISKEYLTSEDINNLEEGIYVYGSSNVNLAIEDFE